MKTRHSFRIIFLVLMLFLFLNFLFFSNDFARIIFRDKIWAHKQNTMDLFFKNSAKYKGIEADIVYHADENRFEVNHPPDESIDLNLEEYLQQYATSSVHHLWLDFKNLGKENSSDAAITLYMTCLDMGVDTRSIIIESPEITYFETFDSLGFQSSYYLPYGWEQGSLEEKEGVLERIELNLTNKQIDYLSMDYRVYPLIKARFPERDLLVWSTNYGYMNKWKARLLFYKILLDDRVKAVLVKA